MIDKDTLPTIVKTDQVPDRVFAGFERSGFLLRHADDDHPFSTVTCSLTLSFNVVMAGSFHRQLTSLSQSWQAPSDALLTRRFEAQLR